MLPFGRLTRPVTMSALWTPPSAVQPLYWLKGVIDTWPTSGRSRHMSRIPRRWDGLRPLDRRIEKVARTGRTGDHLEEVVPSAPLSPKTMKTVFSYSPIFLR